MLFFYRAGKVAGPRVTSWFPCCQDTPLSLCLQRPPLLSTSLLRDTLTVATDLLGSSFWYSRSLPASSVPLPTSSHDCLQLWAPASLLLDACPAEPSSLRVCKAESSPSPQ